MAAFNFPSSPSNGDNYSANGVTFTYNSSSGAWIRASAVGAQGATGNTGAQGATGSGGSTGAQGATGSATISNNADNRVITGGSGTNLNGESNFTFNGTAASISGGLSIDGGSTNNASGQDATLYITANANSDWGVLLDKPSHEYGFRLNTPTSSTLAFAIYGGGSLKHQFFGNGNYTASGSIDSASDLKLKTNVNTIENALDKVLKLRGVEFDRVDMEGHQIGLIAQEVEKIIPEVVHGNETKSVSYGNLVGLLIEAIKELKKEINELKSN